MKDFINIKGVNSLLNKEEIAVEESLFQFTVDFYHGISLLKPNTTLKTTKDYITFLLTKCEINLIRALQYREDDQVLADMDSYISQYKGIIDFKNKDIVNNFINIFNCETDNSDALMKMAAFYCLATAIYEITNDDIIACVKTIN